MLRTPGVRRLVGNSREPLTPRTGKLSSCDKYLEQKAEPHTGLVEGQRVRVKAVPCTAWKAAWFEGATMAFRIDRAAHSPACSRGSGCIDAGTNHQLRLLSVILPGFSPLFSARACRVVKPMRIRNKA